jgi:hypothetical protein
VQWAARGGRCAVCGRRGPVVFHHVVRRRDVEREGGDPWDFANALAVGAPGPAGGRCSCHGDHHSAMRKIPVALLPRETVAYAVRLLGEDRAMLYLRRFYG